MAWLTLRFCRSLSSTWQDSRQELRIFAHGGCICLRSNEVQKAEVASAHLHSLEVFGPVGCIIVAHFIAAVVREQDSLYGPQLLQ